MLTNMVPKLVPDSTALSHTPWTGSALSGEVRPTGRLPAEPNPTVAGSNPAGGISATAAELPVVDLDVERLFQADRPILEKGVDRL
jgi:hypothetical protein